MTRNALVIALLLALSPAWAGEAVAGGKVRTKLNLKPGETRESRFSRFAPVAAKRALRGDVFAERLLKAFQSHAKATGNSGTFIFHGTQGDQLSAVAIALSGGRDRTSLKVQTHYHDGTSETRTFQLQGKRTDAFQTFKAPDGATLTILRGRGVTSYQDPKFKSAPDAPKKPEPRARRSRRK